MVLPLSTASASKYYFYYFFYKVEMVVRGDTSTELSKCNSYEPVVYPAEGM
jgi:hypothetical protein